MRLIPAPKLSSKVFLNHQPNKRVSAVSKKYVTTYTQNGQSTVSQQPRQTANHQSDIINNRQYKLISSVGFTTSAMSPHVQQTKSQPKPLATELMEILKSLTDTETWENVMPNLIKVSNDFKGGKKLATYVVELNGKIKIPLGWTLMESIIDALIDLNKAHLATKFWKDYKLSLPHPPRFSVLAKALAACSASNDSQEIESIFRTLREHNLLNSDNVKVLCQIFGKMEDVRVISHLVPEIKRYGISSSIVSIVQLLDQNEQKLVEAFDNLDFVAARHIFDSMKLALSGSRLRKILKLMLQSPLEDMWQLYNLFLASGHSSPHVFYEIHCYMVQACERKQDLQSALKVLEMSVQQHPAKIDGIMIDAIMRCFMAAFKYEELMEWFPKICDQLRFVPNPFTIEVLVKAITQFRGPHEAVRYINEELPKRKMFITPGMYSIVLDGFSKIGDSFSANVWFEKIKTNFGTPSATDYQSMINMYAERADDVNAVSLYKEATAKGVWEPGILSQVLHCYSVMGAPEIMESYFMRELNQGQDLTFPFVEMLSYYSQRGDVLNVDRLMKASQAWGIRRVPHVLCTAMDGYAKGGHVLKLHQYWQEICDRKYNLLDSVCYEILINYSGWTNNFVDLEKFLGELKQGGEEETKLGKCVLLFHYCRNKDWEKAKAIIETISNLDAQPLFVRTFLLRGYAELGKTQEMEQILQSILNYSRPPSRDDICHILGTLGSRGDSRMMDFFHRCESSWNFRHNWRTFLQVIRHCKPEQLTQCVQDIRNRSIKVNSDLCKMILKRAIQQQDHKLILTFWNQSFVQNWNIDFSVETQCIEILKKAPSILDDAITYQETWNVNDLPSLGEGALKLLTEIAVSKNQVEKALDLLQKATPTTAALKPLSEYFDKTQEDPLQERFQKIKDSVS